MHKETNLIKQPKFNKPAIPGSGTDKIKKHSDICKEMNELYAKKNEDYGDSFAKSYEEYGMAMSCIRLEDKLNRLKSLTLKDKKAKVNDESIEDTLKDLANYAVMTIIELRGEDHGQER